jgi:hypothetical protein
LFIIDPEGIVQYQVVHNLNVGRSVDETLRVLQALAAEGEKQERNSTIFRSAPTLLSSNTFALHTNSLKEMSMLKHHTIDEDTHVEVHIDLCPNDVLHIKIDNICLHLCRQDFLQLAHAVTQTADQIGASREGRKPTKEHIH